VYAIIGVPVDSRIQGIHLSAKGVLMTPRGRKFAFGCTGVVVLVIGLLVAGVYGYGVYTRNSTERDTLAIAQQLGMQPKDQLVARRKCWAQGFECGYTIIFTTSLTRDVLRSQIRALGFNQRFEQAADGNGLLTAINIGTEHNFTIDGNDDIVSVPYEKVPSAWIWDLIKPPDRPVNITFYETSSKVANYAFDGRTMRENVIELLLWDSRP
jgi:hypothetical protein